MRPPCHFVVQFCGIQSPFSALAAAIQPQRKAAARPTGAPISHHRRGQPRSAFLSEDAPRGRKEGGRPRSPALRGAKRRCPGARARPEEDASVRPGQQRASGFKVKRGAALWLPGQRGGPGRPTEGDLDAWKLRRRRRKSEEEQIIRTVERRREESSAVNRVRAEPTCLPSLSCFNHNNNRIQATSSDHHISGSMISEAGSVEAMMRSPPGFPSFVHSPAATLDHTKVCDRSFV